MEGAKAVNGLSQGVDNAASEKGSHRYGETPSGIADEAACSNPAHIVIGHQKNLIAFEAHHFRWNLGAGFAVVDPANVTYGGPAARSGNGHTHYAFNFAGAADGFGAPDLRDQFAKHSLSHPLVLVLTASCICEQLPYGGELSGSAGINNLIGHFNDAGA